MKEIFFLMDGSSIIDRCSAFSITFAQIEFSMRGWVIGDVLSEADFMYEQQQNTMEVA